jgi:hypothetical protein
MEPRAIPASAVVDIWPTVMTETMTREYSNKWVLEGVSYFLFLFFFFFVVTDQKTGKVYDIRTRNSSQYMPSHEAGAPAVANNGEDSVKFSQWSSASRTDIIECRDSKGGYNLSLSSPAASRASWSLSLTLTPHLSKPKGRLMKVFTFSFR